MIIWKKITTLTLIIFLLSAVSAFAQPAGKLRLNNLNVEGNKYTDSGLIIASSGLVVGEELTGEMIQGAIRQLWNLNLFSDIKIVAEDQKEEGVFLLIRVVEYPRLGYIDIGGGKKIGKDDMEKAVDINRGQVLKPSDPIRLKRKLKRLCEEKGYLLAEIKVEIIEDSTEGQSALYIRVNEGKKVKIKKITFADNEAFSDKKLRKQLKNTRQKSLFRSGEFHRDKFDEDLDVLMDFYREQGYRDARIVSDTSWYSDDLKRVFIDITVEEGQQLYFGKVEFSGSDLFNDDELRRQLLFRSGDIFNQKKYDITVRDRLSSLFYDRGYIYAQIQPTLTPAGGDTLDVRVNIEAGNRFSVHKINVTGNTKTREKVIRREFFIKPGDTFDVSRLRRSIREVAVLNYFADVQPDLEDVSEDEVDLWINVEEKPTDQANVSAGYSERDGLIGALGFTAPNLFGRGQQLSFDWNFGSQYGSFSVSYTEPWLLDTETLVGVSFYQVKRRWSEGFTERLVGGSVRLGRRLSWPDDYFRGNWIYRIERSKNTNISETMLEQIDSTSRVSSSLTQIFSRDSRDFVEFPTRGSVVSLTTELAGGLLTGHDDYHKHIFSVEWYTPVLPKLVLYSHFLYGFMAPLTNDPYDIPHLEYFYMGGSGLSLGTSLRGYDERMVGPPSSTRSYAAGGKSQLKSSLELRLQMVDNPTIYGLAFAEAGNTYLDFDRTDPFNLRRSVGLGIRLYMPMIGLIGLDYGYGFDIDASGIKPGWIPHFQFGRTF
ncbi:MAG: outer membrane protein assembly factor BamA [Candidatus Hatepunaea meridiana]|nr:outer membrane protein assembly factor BamA [Candidatus Hatepunaea meridiana]